MTAQTCHIGFMRQLLDRCVVGEEEAWRDLHREYRPVACRFLRRLGVGSADLDDACQDVFVQVFRYLARFEHRADFQTWLYKLCLSQANRVRRRRKLQDALGWLWGRTPTVAEAAWSESDAALKVARALDGMKPLHRQVFVLFELEGVEGSEIARVLDCPAATVRRRLHDARLEFEALLRGDERKP